MRYCVCNWLWTVWGFSHVCGQYILYIICSLEWQFNWERRRCGTNHRSKAVLHVRSHVEGRGFICIYLVGGSPGVLIVSPVFPPFFIIYIYSYVKWSTWHIHFVDFWLWYICMIYLLLFYYYLFFFLFFIIYEDVYWI